MEGNNKVSPYVTHFRDNASKEGCQFVGGALTGYAVHKALKSKPLAATMNLAAKQTLFAYELLFKGRKVVPFANKNYAKWKQISLFRPRGKTGFYHASNMLKRIKNIRVAFIYTLSTSAAALISTAIGSIFSYRDHAKTQEREKKIVEALKGVNHSLKRIEASERQREERIQQLAQQVGTLKKGGSTDAQGGKELSKTGWRSWFPW